MVSWIRKYLQYCCMVNPICVGWVMNQQLRHTQNILFIEELTQYPGVYYTEYACKWLLFVRFNL